MGRFGNGRRVPATFNAAGDRVVLGLELLANCIKTCTRPTLNLKTFSIVSVHLDPNRGKTTNWMRGRVNGTELPISILVDPIIHRPADLQTWAQKLEVFFRQFNVPQHSQYISRVMKTLSQHYTWTNKNNPWGRKSWRGSLGVAKPRSIHFAQVGP